MPWSVSASQHVSGRDLWQFAGIKSETFRCITKQMIVTSADWRRWDVPWGQDEESRKSSYRRLQGSSGFTESLRSSHDGCMNGRRREESDRKSPHSHFWILGTDQPVMAVPAVTVRSQFRRPETGCLLPTRRPLRLHIVCLVSGEKTLQISSRFQTEVIQIFLHDYVSVHVYRNVANAEWSRA